MNENLARWYSSDSTHEYQLETIKMFFESLCVLALCTKVASALEGFRVSLASIVWFCDTFSNNLGNVTFFYKIIERDLFIVF